jgi:hypothetical protein
VISLRSKPFAFNRLSPFTLNGDPNPHYNAQRPWVRHVKKSRPKPPPTYSRALFTRDTPDRALWKLGTHWEKEWQSYAYAVHDKAALKSVWKIGAVTVDQQIDRLLLERLRLTTVDESLWQQAVATTQDSAHLEIRRVQHAIRSAENAQHGIVESLKAVNHHDLIKRLEENYIASQHEISQLNYQLARPVLEKIISRWQDIPRESRRELFDAFANRAELECCIMGWSAQTRKNFCARLSNR